MCDLMINTMILKRIIQIIFQFYNNDPQMGKFYHKHMVYFLNTASINRV